MQEKNTNKLNIISLLLMSILNIMTVKKEFSCFGLIASIFSISALMLNLVICLPDLKLSKKER